MTSNTPETQALLPVTAEDRKLWSAAFEAWNAGRNGFNPGGDHEAAAAILARHRQSSSNAGGVDELYRLLDNVGGFLDSFAQADLDEGAADAVTVGMVYQQQAQTVVLPRIRAALASLSTPAAEPTDLFAENAKKSGAETLDGLEWTEDGYSLRTPYDGDADGDGRPIIVGGEIVVTFSDSDEGDKYRERILRALTAPPTPDRIGKDAVREALLDQPFANTAPIEWGDYEWQSLARALSATPAQPVDETERLCAAVQEGIDQLHWINAQAENAMATSAGAATANGDSDGALQMLNSISSDIGINAMMLRDNLSAALQHKGEVSRG